MSLWEIKVEMDPDQVERIEEFLTEREESGWHLFQEPWVRQILLGGYFGTREEADAAWAQLSRELPPGWQKGEPVVKELEDAEWQDAYKHHFKAWHFEGLHWVPVWERETFEIPAGEEVVWLDPGMAFGTGNHETTRLCVERIVEFRREWKEGGREVADATVIDGGCGSGILAISAAKCGFGQVAGFDLDPVAVQVSEENAQLNGLGGVIEFFEADVEAGLRGRQADLVVANIQADILCANATHLWGSVKAGGRLILSGILARELPDVRNRFMAAAPEAAVDSRELGEWADLRLSRPEKFN
jgi:ribosomal protein L11 methyltransferase